MMCHRLMPISALSSSRHATWQLAQWPYGAPGVHRRAGPASMPCAGPALLPAQADQVTESLMHTQQQKSQLEKKVADLEQVGGGEGCKLWHFCTFVKRLAALHVHVHAPWPAGFAACLVPL